MNAAAIKERTDELFGLVFFTDFDSKSYVDWAVAIMELGVENENLYILAGLDDSDTVEREKYFKKTLNDLKIEMPEDAKSYADKFMASLAEKVLSGKITPAAGLKLAAGINIQTDYELGYLQFDYLDEDLDYVEYEGHALFSNNMEKGKSDEYIKKEFEIWQDAHLLQLDDITKLVYCAHCDAVVNPVLKKKYKFFRHVYDYYRCNQCNSTMSLLFGTGQDGRAKILSALKGSTRIS